MGRMSRIIYDRKDRKDWIGRIGSEGYFLIESLFKNNKMIAEFPFVFFAVSIVRFSNVNILFILNYPLLINYPAHPSHREYPDKKSTLNDVAASTYVKKNE